MHIRYIVKFVKKYCLPIAIAVIVLCASTSAAAASKTEFEAFYNKWKNRPVSELKEQGVKCIRNNDFDMAVTFFNMMVRRYDAGAPVEEQLMYASAYINSGGILAFNYADYQQAYSYFMNAYDISKRFNLKQTLPYVYANLGSLYSEMDDDKQAILYFNLAMSTSIDCRDWYAANVVSTNIFMYAMEHATLPSYYPLVDRLQRAGIPDSVPSGRFLNRFLHTLGMIRAKRYADAIVACDSIAACINARVYETPDIMLSVVHKSKSYIYSYMEMYGRAIDECSTSTRLVAACDPNNLMIRDNYLTMSALYKKQNRMDSAYIYLEKARSFRSTVSVSGRKTAKDRLETLYKLEKKNAEIDIITRKSQIMTAVMIISAIVFVFVLAILAMIYKHNKRLKEKNRQIYLNNMQLLERDKSVCRQLLEYESKITIYEQRIAEMDSAKAQLQDGGKTVAAEIVEEGDSEEPIKEKYQGSSLSESGKIGILQKIQHVMDSSEDIYSPDFSVGKLAQLVDVNPKYISQVINEFYKKNFSLFLGEYRIKEVCRRLAAPGSYGQYTIEAVSAGVGFKSRSAFFTMFKKVTGITPSEYIKVAGGNGGI